MCSSGKYNSSTNACNGDFETTKGGFPKVCTVDSDCEGIYGSSGSCKCIPNTQGN